MSRPIEEIEAELDEAYKDEEALRLRLRHNSQTVICSLLEELAQAKKEAEHEPA